MTFFRKVVITIAITLLGKSSDYKKKQNSGAANRDCRYCIDSIDLMITYSSRLDAFEFFFYLLRHK